MSCNKKNIYTKRKRYILTVILISMISVISIIVNYIAELTDTPSSSWTMAQTIEEKTDTINQNSMQINIENENQSDEFLEEFDIVAENNKFKLFFNPETAEIAVFDKSKNEYWFSNPPGRESDKLAVGINKMNLNSQMFVRYSDKINQISLTNSHTGSVLRETFSSVKIQNGIEVNYDFSRDNEKFNIAVRYTITDECFTAEIPSDYIKEYGESKIVEISLLPYFGAAGIDEDGYIMVPDGSGSLIYLNNGKENMAQYKQHVYGRDPILTKLFDNSKSQPVLMPVFGIKTSSKTFLTIVDSGDALSTINAQVSRNSDSYNRVWASFQYRLVDSTVLASTDLTAKDVMLISNLHIGIPSFKNCYYFLYEDDSNYSGMARTYRNFLIAKYNLKPKESTGYPFISTFYGGLAKKESFMGFPVDRFNSLTTFSQIIENTDYMIEKGINNPVVLVKGWEKGGYLTSGLGKRNPEKALGGKRGMDELKNFMNGKGFDFFLDFDLINLYSDKNAFFRILYSSRTVSRAPALQYEYLLSTNTKNLNTKPWNLIKPEKVEKLAENIEEITGDDDKTGFASSTLGSLFYSDVRRDEIYDREKTKNSQLDILQSFNSKKLLESPILPFAVLIDYAIKTPSTHSNYDIEDEAIPFYQIVLHGITDYTIEPSNHHLNDNEYVLKILENGASPFYEFTEDPTQRLSQTGLSSLYSNKFSDHIDNAVEEYLQLENVLSSLNAVKIKSHSKIANNIVLVEYENGSKIYINYSNEIFVNDGLNIPSKGYKIVN